MWSPSPKIRLNISYRLGWNKFRHPGISHSYIDHFVILDASWRPWKGGELNLNAIVANPSLQSLAAAQSIKVHYMVTGYVGIAQSLGKGWFAGISASEPWYGRRNMIVDYETDGQRYYFRQSDPGHIFRATVRYDFGRFARGVKRNSRKVTDTDRTRK